MLYVYPKELFPIAESTKKKGAAMSGLELAIGIMTILPVSCKVASIIFEKGKDIYNHFKTSNKNTSVTVADSKQQDKIRREIGDEMRDISITSKLSSERISQVFIQVPTNF